MTDSQKDRVLLIDDDEDFCRLLSKRVSSVGYPVVWSTQSSGIDELIGKTLPSVIILDLQLADSDGLTVLKAIQQCDPELPIIMLTGYESIETAVKAMKGGAFHYLTKPVDFDQLKTLLDAAVQKRHAPFSESKGALHLDLPSDPTLGMASERAKESVEKKLILETLDKTEWHQGRAAAILKVDPKTLYNKMKSYGIRGR